MNKQEFEKLAKLIRYNILKMTTGAGSGHVTSSFSAVEIMTALYFESLRFDLENPDDDGNDRVIFSKGHVSPLIYALYAVAGEINEDELATYRRLGSVLEGHPTHRFKFAEAATGSLGQGLSVGVGMALALRAKFQIPNSKYQNLPNVYVLMGDSETAEGSVWEAAELASFYRLNNLVAIVDVNRLGQRGETMLGWETEIYKSRFESFGWDVCVCNGHDFEDISKAFNWVEQKGDKPKVIIAKTIKGKGVSFLENKDGWHGKPLSRDEFEEAVGELGEIDKTVRSAIKKPETELKIENGKLKVDKGDKDQFSNFNSQLSTYKVGDEVATRKAYGEALATLGETNERIVSLDAEVSNSTYAEIFKNKFPDRFIESFVAEQNMVGMAIGYSRLGYVPFVSTFAAFFTRAFDQIRMSAYSGANVKFVGSHSGVSIGEDGPSQMGLEDVAMFKSVFGSVVMCPSDAVSCAGLVSLAANNDGIFYVRTARPATPVIYKNDEEFKIGGSKVLKSSNVDEITIISCGVTISEVLKATEELDGEGIKVGVIDAYSIKPIDEETIKSAAKNSNNLVMTVEDHYYEGGLGDSVLNVFAREDVRVIKLAVTREPMSGKPDELLEYEGISKSEIIKKIKEVI